MTAPRSLDPSLFDPSASLEAFAPLLLSIGESQMTAPIDKRGVATVAFPKALAEKLRIPKGVDHAKDWEKSQKFSPHMATTRSEENKTGLLLWLTPHLLGDEKDTPEISPKRRAQWQTMANEYATMLGDLHGIDIEARLFVPTGQLRSATRKHLCAGLILAAPQDQADILQENVYEHVMHMRTSVQQQHAWQQHNSAPEPLALPAPAQPKPPVEPISDYDAEQRFDQILSYAIADPIIKNVPGNGAPLVLHTPRYTPPPPPSGYARLPRAHPGSAENKPHASAHYRPERFHEPLSVNPRDHNNDRFPTHALVLWLDPKYNLPTGEAYNEAKDLSDEEIGDFCCAAGLLFGMQLDCHLEQPRDPERPCALVIYADSPRQQADLMRLQGIISAHRRGLGRDTPESQAR